MAKATRVRLLDSGSLVIDQSHITWNVGCGTPVRFPVYSVLIEHPDGLFMFDSGYDLDLVNAMLPFELPQQTEEQTVPAQLARCGYKPDDVDVADQLAPAFRSLSAPTSCFRTRPFICTATSCARRGRRALRAARVRGPGMGPPRRAL